MRSKIRDIIWGVLAGVLFTYAGLVILTFIYYFWPPVGIIGIQ